MRWRAVWWLPWWIVHPWIVRYTRLIGTPLSFSSLWIRFYFLNLRWVSIWVVTILRIGIRRIVGRILVVWILEGQAFIFVILWHFSGYLITFACVTLIIVFGFSVITLIVILIIKVRINLFLCLVISFTEFGIVLILIDALRGSILL